jgi:hypothetical protein
MLAYEYSKPDFAYKFFPEWFVKLPKKVISRNEEMDSIKACLAFKRYYTSNNIIIPSPYNATINVSSIEQSKYEWFIKYPEEKVMEHEKLQFEDFLSHNYQHLKFSNPWKFKTNKFINFMWTDPVWNRSNVLDYSLLPGIVDYKYQVDAAINLIFKYTEKPYLINLNLGEPLVMLTPLLDCNIKIKHHLLSKNEVSALGFVSKSRDESKYKDAKKTIQAAEKRDAMKKCPFHLR